MVRILLIFSLYNISPSRRLISAIIENIAYRWSCFPSITSPAFDHSTVRYFIEHIGRDGLGIVFNGLNEELLRLVLLPPEMYADSSLVKANASSHPVSPIGLTIEDFREQAIEENGLFALNDSGADENGVEWEGVRFCQDSKVHLHLSPLDTDARWRTGRLSKSNDNYRMAGGMPSWPVQLVPAAAPETANTGLWGRSASRTGFCHEPITSGLTSRASR